MSSRHQAAREGAAAEPVLGQHQIGSKFTVLAVELATSLVQISFMARTCSTILLKRVLNTVP